MRLTAPVLFLTAILVAGCKSGSFEGVYVGELRSESYRDNGSMISGGDDASTEANLTLKVRQDGDRVSLEISRSRLLGDCELFLKVSKNETAYVEPPQTCTQSLPLDGTMTNNSGELTVVLRGFDSTSSKTFRFKGYKK